jgi:hypothetical protein
VELVDCDTILAERNDFIGGDLCARLARDDRVRQVNLAGSTRVCGIVEHPAAEAGRAKLVRSARV